MNFVVRHTGWAESKCLVENVSIFGILSQFFLHFTLSVHRVWEFLSAKFHLKICLISIVLDKGKSILFRERMRFHRNALFKESTVIGNNKVIFLKTQYGIQLFPSASEAAEE